MTVGGTAFKTLFLLLVVIGGGAWGWASATTPVPTDPGGGYGNTTVTVPGGFWLASFGAFFVAIFLAVNPRRAALLGVLSALLEGYCLGAVSAAFDAQTDGIVAAAILSTIAVFIVALFLYVTRIVKPTQKLAFGLIAGIGGLSLLYLFVWVLSIFDWGFLYSDQFHTVGVIVTVIAVVLAALSLTLDFAFIEGCIDGEAPKFIITAMPSRQGPSVGSREVFAAYAESSPERGEPDGSAPGAVKLVYLLRHAKSSWEDPSLPDHDRPLAPRGRRAAHKVADHLRRSGIAPAIVLCSTARRASETLDAILPAFEPPPDVRREDELYGASAEELVHRLRWIPPSVPSALLIGHNPGIQSAALVLAGSADQALVARLRDKMPTGGLATLELDGEWTSATVGSALLVSFVVPRELS